MLSSGLGYVIPSKMLPQSWIQTVFWIVLIPCSGRQYSWMQLWAVSVFIVIRVWLFSPCSHFETPGPSGFAHSGMSVSFFASKTEVLLFTLPQFNIKGEKLSRADSPPKQEWGIKSGLFAIKERILEYHKTWRNADYIEQWISLYNLC